MDDARRLDELQQRVAELESRLAAALAAAGSNGAPPPVRPGDTSRRRLFQLAAGAAMGGVAATVAAAPAAADDHNPLLIGETNVQAQDEPSTTVIDYASANPPLLPAGPDTAANGNVFLVRDRPTADAPPYADISAFPAAVAGYADRAVRTGVFGRSTVPTGYGGVFIGPTAIYAVGSNASLRLAGTGAVPTERTDQHATGELLVANDGGLY